MQTNLNNK